MEFIVLFFGIISVLQVAISRRPVEFRVVQRRQPRVDRGKANLRVYMSCDFNKPQKFGFFRISDCYLQEISFGRCKHEESEHIDQRQLLQSRGEFEVPELGIPTF